MYRHYGMNPHIRAAIWEYLRMTERSHIELTIEVKAAGG
jgi:hypothetical protein